ncbi:glycoside hydrolase family 88 protein [Candidatus Latescibacterota bacterium]
MKKYSIFTIIIMLFGIIVSFVSCSGPVPEIEPESGVSIPIEETFDFAAEQLEKTVVQIDDSERFPRFINEEGIWETLDSHAWSSGFFAGCLWFMYEHTGDDNWKIYAIKWTDSMEREQFNKENHNNGFMMFSSFGNGYLLTGDEHYREVLIESARSLASRYSDAVGFIKANDMEQWSFPVLIDTMVNIRLLFWAAENGGDPEWGTIAETHTLNTIRDHIRADGSTVQLIDYNPSTGDIITHDTLCGLNKDSAWARGQGQAIYGFAAAYDFTRNPAFLDAARKVADNFIMNLPDDYVPFWDFSDPNIPDTIRDSSAASIAAAGLFELARIVPDNSENKKYNNAAVHILSSLCTNYLADRDSSNGILDHATWKKPEDPQADTSLIWGDYNFFEALMMYKKGM